MEFTAPRTPEQNGIVERAFSVLYNHVRAMLNRAGFEAGMRRQMWAECANMAVQLDNIHIRCDNLSTYERFHNKKPNEWKELRSFGEIAVVKTADSLQQKLKNKGTVVMMVGYCNNHGRGTYRFYNMNKKSIMMSRDVVWLEKWYHEHENIKKEQQSIITIDTKFYEKYFQQNEEIDETVTKLPPREVRNLEIDRNESRMGKTRSKTIEISKNIHHINMVLCTSITKYISEPTSFKKAWNHQDEEIRKKWREAIKKELNDIKNRKVWTKIPRKKGIRTIGLIWGFKVKTDNRFQARLVALGYKQLAGIDFTDIHAPVMHEMTLRIMILIKIKNKWTAVKIDVEAAFLDSRVMEVLYIDLPEGLDLVETVDSNEVGKLNAAIYGLTQAARAFYTKMRTFLKQKLVFEECLSEPLEIILPTHYILVVCLLWARYKPTGF